MRAFKLFVVVELASILALLIFAMFIAAVGFFAERGTAFQSASGAASAYFQGTFLFGAVPALAFGGPIYFTMLQRGEPRWRDVLLLGVALGLVALFFNLLLGGIAVIGGASVACLTHALCRKFGPNNSFKPRPLRGSA